MEPVLVPGAEGVGGHRLIALHKAHDHVAADEDQPLDHAVGGDDLIGLREGRGGDVGERGGHRQADLDDRRGDADEGDGLHQIPAGPERPDPDLDNGPAAGIEPDQNEEGDELGDSGGQGGACHAHVQAPAEHEYRVQGDVQQGAGDDRDRGDPHGGLGSGGAVHALGGQIGQGGHEHPEGVVLRQGQGGVRGAEGPHQRFHEDDAAHAQQNADEHGDADDGGNGAAGALRVLGPQLTARQNGGAGGKDVFDGHHDQQQGDGDAHRRQGDVGVQHPDVRGVHQIVDGLGQQRQRGRNGQPDDGLGGTHVPQNGLRFGFFFRHFHAPFLRSRHRAGCSMPDGSSVLWLQIPMGRFPSSGGGR